LGNILSFIVTWAYARIVNAQVFLRIDDLDHERVRREFVEDIFSSLEFLGLSWDLGPKNLEDFQKSYSQRLRLGRYDELLQELSQHPNRPVYGCQCTRKSLKAIQDVALGCPGKCYELHLDLAQTPVWRFRSAYRLKHRLSGGDPVVRRREGYAAYHIASLADDIDYGCNLIIRGEDLAESSKIQQEIASYLKEGHRFTAATIHHHAMLTGPDGAKLSKSRSSPPLYEMRQNGLCSKDLFRWVSTVLGLPHQLATAQDVVETFRDKAESLLSFKSVGVNHDQG
jgi:glutamyl-tRNA synthetase